MLSEQQHFLPVSGRFCIDGIPTGVDTLLDGNHGTLELLLKKAESVTRPILDDLSTLTFKVRPIAVYRGVRTHPWLYSFSVPTLLCHSCCAKGPLMTMMTMPIRHCLRDVRLLAAQFSLPRTDEWLSRDLAGIGL